ncbi:MAG: type IX secretion system outer membrane channel protein PorV, partial [Bacteroidota bacterium]|nr:type IX secretion system outer membrane channel protein PorV [Bacteroidota bacterium]
MRKILFSVKLLALMLLVFASAGVKAQDMNVITTGVPFLMISPDARGGSMGDVGVASTPTINSMFWNPAKYAFIEGDMGVGISYSPWLRELVDDMGLSQVNFFTRLDDRQVVAASLRYFSLGDINFTGPDGEELGTYSPNQFAIDLAYSRKLTDKLSLAVTGKFIYSNLTLGQGEGTRAGTSVAADVAMYYTTPLNLSSLDADFAFGVNISNIGSKISYTNNVDKDFIPTNLRLGPSLNLKLDAYNEIAFNLDFNKLLVPTPPIMKDDDS